MPKKDSAPRRDFPSYRGAFYVRENRGRAVVVAWPRTRPRPRHPKSEYWSEWLRQANVAFKALPEKFRGPIRDAARGWPQMPRDLAFATMRGTLWSYTTDEGFTRYPMQALSKVSESLDVVTKLRGALLVRGDLLWTYADPGSADGDVLTWNAANQIPEFRTPTGGQGSQYTAPLLAAYPLFTGAPAPTIVQAATNPLVLARAASASFPRIGAALRTITTPPRTYTYGLAVLANFQNNSQTGIVIRDHATGRSLIFGVTFPSAAAAPQLAVQYWTSDSAWSSTALFRVVTYGNVYMLRLLDDGINFTFSASADDANYISIGSLGRAAWCAAPSHIGFGASNRAAETMGSTVSAYHYHDE